MYSAIRAQVRPISTRSDCKVAPKSGRDTAEGENFALTGKTEEVGDWTSRVSTTIVVKFYCTPPAPAVSQLAKSAWRLVIIGLFAPRKMPLTKSG